MFYIVSIYKKFINNNKYKRDFTKMNNEKQRVKTHKQVALFLKSMHEAISDSKDISIAVNQVLQNLYWELKDNHIGVIVALHNSEILLTVLQVLNKKSKQERNERYEVLLELIYKWGYDCFLSKNEKYLKFFKGFKQKYQQKVKLEYQGFSKAVLYSFWTLQQLLLSFFQIKQSGQQSIPQLKQLQYFINEQIKLISPENAFQECYLGWLKIQAAAMQKSVYDKLRITTNSLCCRFHFVKNERIQYLQTNNIKFMPEGAKKFEYKERKEYLKRVIISYLNGFGGVIYFGIEDNLKKATIVGVPISKEQRQAFLKFIIEQLVFNIYPYEDDIKQDNDQGIKTYRKQKLQEFQEQWSKVLQNQYMLTEFISVEFINIHQHQTLICTRNQQDQTLYVVKINIRPGSQYKLYHLINQKDTPEAYLCEGKKQKPCCFKDYYEEMYRRLKAEANNKRYDKGESPVHQYCRSFRKLQQKKER